MSLPQFLQSFVSLSIQATVVVAIAFAADRWTRHNASQQARVWSACFLGLLGLIGAGLLLPHVQWGNPWQSLPLGALRVTLDTERSLAMVVLVIWILGATVQSARSALRLVGMHYFMAGLPRLTEGARQRIVSIIGVPAATLRGQTIDFREGPDDLGPFCYQLHRPTVFLPTSILHGDQRELQLVLQHELTHLRTQHALQVFLENATACLLWFHPSVAAASRRAGLVREFVCDDAASREGASTVAYLRLLLRVAESTGQSPSPALGLRRSVSEMQARVRRLAAPGDEAIRLSGAEGVRTVIVASLIAALLWVPLDPLTSPRAWLSPWPTWSASVLHTLDLPVRDFQPYDERTRVHELVESNESGS